MAQISINPDDIQIVRDRFIAQEIGCSSSLAQRTQEIIDAPISEDAYNAVEWYRAIDLINGAACGHGSDALNERLRQAMDSAHEHHGGMNWWQMYYGVPKELGKALLNLQDKNLNAIPSDLRIRAEDYVKDYSFGVADEGGGGNTMWPVFARLAAGLYFEDTDMLEKAVELARYGVRQTAYAGEGGPDYGNTQKDWCYFTHGQQLSMGYGADGFMDLSKYLRLTEGTSLSLADKTVPNDPQGRSPVRLLADWYTNYIRWIIYNGKLDPYTITRGTRLAQSYSWRIQTGLDNLLNTNYPEIKPLHEEMRLLKDKNLNLIGAVAYPIGNLLVAKRPNFFTSIRMVNLGMAGEENCSFSSMFGNFYFITRQHSEIVNRDNVLNYPSVILKAVTFPEQYLTNLQKPGDEGWGGFGIYSMTYGNWGYYGQSTLDGYYAMAAENLKGSDFGMKKSWFVFDDEIVSLGSGIYSTNTNNQRMLTWIDTFEKDNSTLNTSAGSKPIATQGDIGRLNWLHHDDTGIIFLNGLDVKGEQVSDNHHRYYLDHGTTPDDAKYVAIYLPGSSLSQTQAYVNNPDVEIIQQDNKLHLVREKKSNVVGVAFFGAASNSLVSSNLPAYIMYKAGNEFSFSLHNPHKESKVEEDPDYKVGWTSGAEIPILSVKVDYKVSEAQATKHNYSITLPISFSKADDCHGCNLFTLSNSGRTINVSIRPYRKFEFDANGSNQITKAWISFNDAIETGGSSVPDPPPTPPTPPTPPSPANTCASYPDADFCDDFSDSDFSNWTIQELEPAGNSPVWSIDNGWLKEKSDVAHAVLIAPFESNVSNYTLKVKTKAQGDGNERVGIVFNYQDQDNFYVFEWVDPNGYYNSSTAGRQLIYKQGGIETILEQDTGVIMNQGQVYELSVSITGKQINAFVDGNQVLTHSVNNNLILQKSALITRDNDGGIFYDDFRVIITSAPPTPPNLSSDFNCDNKIDIQDFGILLSNWHKSHDVTANYKHNNCANIKSIDLVIDKNNRVDSLDLSKLLSCWGIPSQTESPGCWEMLLVE